MLRGWAHSELCRADSYWERGRPRPRWHGERMVLMNNKTVEPSSLSRSFALTAGEGARAPS